jgi:hypothetical protein
VGKAGPIVYPEFILKNQYSLSIINKAQQIVHFEVKEENFRGIFMEKILKGTSLALSLLLLSLQPAVLKKQLLQDKNVAP